MADRFRDKVAVVTGAARGQGRSHAVRLGAEGADVIAIDVCAGFETVDFYPSATVEDLAQTVAEVQEAGSRAVAVVADVRDFDALSQALDSAIERLGRPPDVVVANAGIFTFGTTHLVSESAWRDTVDVNLTGVWHTIKACVPHMLKSGRGGAVVLVSSLGGSKGFPHVGAYVAAKHGIVGLAKVCATEYGEHGIRFNCVLPNTVATPMVQNDATYKLFRPDLTEPSFADASPVFASKNPMGIPMLDVNDVSNAVLFLASDDARYITGAQLPVDAGACVL
jgi:SDR family mycofactocin-dependent oxidoreductase